MRGTMLWTSELQGGFMKVTSLWPLAIASLISIQPLTASGDAQDKQRPTVKVPEPGVPQLMTLEGTWTRVAYNNEGYAIIGYRLANLSIGEPWLLLEFGTTVRDGVPNQTMKRDALSVETPDGKTIPMATIAE